MKQISLGLFGVITVVPFMAIGYLIIDLPYYYFIGSTLFGLIHLLLALFARKDLIKPNEYYKNKKDLINIGKMGVGLSLACTFLMYALPDYKQNIFSITPLIYGFIISLYVLINTKIEKGKIKNNQRY